MKTLWRQLQGLTTYASDAQTVPIKLPLSGILHSLYLTLQVTNGATNARDLSIADAIDQIDLIANGSDVLVSLQVEELRNWHYLKAGKFPSDRRSEWAGAIQRLTLPIYFGRWWNDPEYWLPSANLSDLELRIAYSPTIGATSFATGTTSIGVVGYYTMEGNPGAYRGTLGHKTVNAFTSVASGDNEILLPRGNPLGGVMVYAYEAGTDPFANITTVRLGLNNDETVIVNELFQSLQERNAEEYWLNDSYQYRAHLADTNTCSTKIAPVKSALVTGGTVRGGANGPVYFKQVTAIAGDQLTVEADTVQDTAGTTGVAADATARNALVTVEGVGLPNAVFIDTSPFGLETALQTKLYDQVKLVLTNGNAGAAVRTSIEEIRLF